MNATSPGGNARHFIDRRRWLKTMVATVAGGFLARKMFGAAGAGDGGPAKASSDLPEVKPAVANENTDRRYILGFETYSGF
jgi:hypothetical protein